MPQIYIAISIIVLAVIALLLIVKGKSKTPNGLSPLAGLAFGFVLAGVTLGDNRFVGYSLLGVGVFLAVIDMARKRMRT